MRSVYCLAVRRCTVEEPPASFQPVPIHEITEAPRPSPVECCLTPVDDRSRFRDVDDHAVQVWLSAAYSQIFHCFCRAMLCKRGLCRHAVSVRHVRVFRRNE